jgi:hypothetical protein
LALGLGAPAGASAYDGRMHQELTFLAAKQLNRCLGDTAAQPFTPLQVREIAARSAELADGGFFARLFRWHYFDPLERDDSSVAWVLETRFTEHFREEVRELDEARQEEDTLRAFGRLLAYLQMVSSPARAVPVYAPRFWRLTFSDRFDHFPLREAELEARLADDCSHLAHVPAGFEDLLVEVAADTVGAVKGSIGRLPATWESFWALPEEPGEFGSYGPAGNNFGRYVEFPCGTGDIHRCVLITDDPAYLAFAFDRQLAAVRATARAMLLLRRSGALERVGTRTAAGDMPDAE